MNSPTTTHIVKVEHEGDIYKYRDISNFTDLLQCISSSFETKVLRCKFHYVDDEDDKIVVTNDEDLEEAISYFSPRPAKLHLQKFIFKSNGVINMSSSNEKNTLVSDFDDFSNLSFLSLESDQEDKEKDFYLDIQEVDSVIEDADVVQDISPSKLKKCDSIRSSTKREQPILDVPKLNLPTSSDCEVVMKSDDAQLETRNYGDVNVNRSRFASHSLVDIGELESTNLQLSPISNDCKCVTTRNEFDNHQPLVLSNLKTQISDQISQEFSKMDLSNLIKNQVVDIIPSIISQISQNINSPTNHKNRPNKALHKVACSGCKSDVILGARYKCIACASFNL